VPAVRRVHEFSALSFRLLSQTPTFSVPRIRLPAPPRRYVKRKKQEGVPSSACSGERQTRYALHPPFRRQTARCAVRAPRAWRSPIRPLHVRCRQPVDRRGHASPRPFSRAPSEDEYCFFFFFFARCRSMQMFEADRRATDCPFSPVQADCATPFFAVLRAVCLAAEVTRSTEVRFSFSYLPNDVFELAESCRAR